MIQTTAALNHWLALHGIDPKGVRLIVEFPSEALAVQAKAALTHDLRPHMRYIADEPVSVDTMNGLGLIFRSTCV